MVASAKFDERDGDEGKGSERGADRARCELEGAFARCGLAVCIGEVLIVHCVIGGRLFMSYGRSVRSWGSRIHYDGVGNRIGERTRW